METARNVYAAAEARYLRIHSAPQVFSIELATV
jgi:hypothetical protein